MTQHTDRVLTHLGSLVARVVPNALAPTAMWPAAVDLLRGGYPPGPPLAGKRVYRNIDAPFGCSLYWDQPTITAARSASQLDPAGGYAEASRRYIQEFLATCVAHNGIFLWGNHYFFRPSDRVVLGFKGEEEPKPINPATDTARWHEMRPLVPNWDAFWEIDPAATTKQIDASSRESLFDEATGGFNRHADRKREHAFIESGGVLVESLAWLVARQPNPQLLERALRIARFSFGERGKTNGLVRNEPTYGRWDSKVCTTEVGLWAQSLVRAADLTGEGEFRLMAAEAVAAYLKYGWDESAQTYYGAIQVDSGEPQLTYLGTTHAPALHVDFWHPWFPRHDYPWAMATVCLTLLERTGRPEFEEGARRWMLAVRGGLEQRSGRQLYAEHYGLCLDYLATAKRVLGPAAVGDLESRVAADAVEQLYVGPMFRGHMREDRYDAVDGVGYLLNALLRLEGASA